MIFVVCKPLFLQERKLLTKFLNSDKDTAGRIGGMSVDTHAGGHPRFWLSWRVTFPKKRVEPSSPVGVCPASFIEVVQATFPKPPLLGKVYHQACKTKTAYIGLLLLLLRLHSTSVAHFRNQPRAASE